MSRFIFFIISALAAVIFIVPAKFVMAQDSAIASLPRLNDALATTIVASVIGPAAAILVTACVGSWSKDNETRWIVQRETTGQLVKDRDEARDLAESRLKEVDKLQDELRALSIAYTGLEWQVKDYKRRLAYLGEPVTGDSGKGADS